MENQDDCGFGSAEGIRAQLTELCRKAGEFERLLGRAIDTTRVAPNFYESYKVRLRKLVTFLDFELRSYEEESDPHRAEDNDSTVTWDDSIERALRGL